MEPKAGQEILEGFRIVLLAMAAAILYGGLHDLVTAHVSPEYFTVAHPPVFATRSPVLLALGWGVLSTWWVGLVLGLLLASAARIGTAPRLGWRSLRRPIAWLMLASAAAALLACLVGGWLGAGRLVALPAEWAQLIPSDRHAPFLAVAFAHSASYGAGAMGGLFLMLRTMRQRRRLARPG